ncbi:MAG: T9SS type A sorting domain-containing protein [Phaeodactylibacter sp.]|nr:T9SS type A sorting domain-containing protein [Phaeodactylibacter sp.]
MLGGQSHTENCWANGGRAVYDGVTETFAANLPFLVDAGDNPCFLPMEVEPSQGWFEDFNNENPMPPCAAPQCGLGGFDHESPDAHLIAEGQIEAGVYTDAVRWALNRYLYKKAYGLPLESNIMQDFFDTHLHSTVGAFYEMDSRLNALYNANAEDVAAMAAGLDSLAAGLDALAALDIQLLEASEENRPALLAVRSELLDDVTEWAGNAAALYKLVAEERAQLAEPLKTQNESINASFIYEQNEKDVNDILLSNLERGGTGLEAGELQTLESIAEQCPFSGGRAVFRARAFLAAESRAMSWYDDGTACSEAERTQPTRASQETKPASQIRLYPNPAKQQATILWSEPLQKQGAMELYDAFGRKQLTVALEKGLQEYRLLLHRLPAGLYFLRVSAGGQEESFKLIVKP